MFISGYTTQTCVRSDIEAFEPALRQGDGLCGPQASLLALPLLLDW